MVLQSLVLVWLEYQQARITLPLTITFDGKVLPFQIIFTYKIIKLFSKIVLM